MGRDFRRIFSVESGLFDAAISSAFFTENFRRFLAIAPGNAGCPGNAQ